MTAPSDLPTLYKTKKVYVWVEDEETRTYLTAVWQDPEIGRSSPAATRTSTLW